MLVRRVIQTLCGRQSVGVLLQKVFVVPVLFVLSVFSHCSPLRCAQLSLSAEPKTRNPPLNVVGGVNE
jgi:hypothetical protein